jgi:hypothetical protein
MKYSLFEGIKKQAVLVFSSVSFLFALVMNALANILPLNGLSTGEISDLYFNYFAPTGLTFSIWAVIYIGLSIYLFLRVKLKDQFLEKLTIKQLNQIDILFGISSLANGLWIISWHYLQFYFSLVWMIIILIALIAINQKIRKISGKMFIPFRIYFGWITIATVANVTTLIVSDANQFRWLWNGGEVSQQILTLVILIIAITIGALTTFLQNDLYYGSVIVWALFGIYLRHTENFPEFGIIMISRGALLGIFVIGLVMIGLKKNWLIKTFSKTK